MAKKRIESSWDKLNSETPIYLVDLIKYRELSNQISSDTNIEHQSPQLILISSGKSVYDASHISISSKAAAKYI